LLKEIVDFESYKEIFVSILESLKFAAAYWANSAGV